MSEFKPISKLLLGDRVKVGRSIWVVVKGPYWSEAFRSMGVIIEYKGKQKFFGAYTLSKDGHIAKAVGVEVVGETVARTDIGDKRKRTKIPIGAKPCNQV
jgi:hypothetical protein